MCIAIAASELNELDIMVGEVSSTYLEAYTQEKGCFIAGPQFVALEGRYANVMHIILARQTQMSG
jgi:hypothetical protein